MLFKPLGLLKFYTEEPLFNKFTDIKQEIDFSKLTSSLKLVYTCMQSTSPEVNYTIDVRQAATTFSFLIAGRASLAIKLLAQMCPITK